MLWNNAMQPQTLALLSAEDYLKRERAAEFRSEYHAGQVIAMAGASRTHNRIVTNISASLHQQLQDRPCNNYSSDLRVAIQNGRRYVYPDIVVTCGPEEFTDDYQDSLVNPLVIIEVLSTATEAYDRGTKFLYYQAIPSLKEYLLVSQEPRCLESYRKQDDGSWVYRALLSPAETLEIPAITCTLNFTQVYAKVDPET